MVLVVVEARDLPVNRRGALPNAQVLVEGCGQKTRTEVFHRSADPSWGVNDPSNASRSRMCLPCFGPPPFADRSTVLLVLSVVDHATLGKSEQLGKLEITAAAFAADAAGEEMVAAGEQWFCLDGPASASPPEFAGRLVESTAC